MFDTTKTHTIDILSGGEKRCECSFPTDQQWSELAKKRKSVKRKTGRGLSDWEEPGREQAEMDLLVAIGKPGTAEQFDKFEASKMIGLLSRAEVLETERDGSGFRVELKVFGGVVFHTVGIPTMEDRFRYDREVSRITNTERRVELYVNLAPCAEIWDRLRVNVEGYAEGSAIPIIHKAAALSGVISKLQELENDDPEA
jgi:hypothetical protein